MIIVADSGSSKCDWAYFDLKDKKITLLKQLDLTLFY